MEGGERMKLLNDLRAKQVRCALRLREVEGSALVEMALAFPVMLIAVSGILGFGLMLNQDIQLNNAVKIGAQYLSDRRGNTTDPCADTISAIEAAAPNLQSSQMTFSITINGNTPNTFAKGATATCTGGVTELNSAQYQPLIVQATYPCSVAVYGNSNILGSSCTLTAQVEVVTQ